MLTHPTHERLIALGLTGMAKALEEQRRQGDLAALDFEERLALMIDRETIERENKRLASRLKVARLRNRPLSRTSISKCRAASTRRCLPSSSLAIGSNVIRIC
jgi:IstB-like ATP binding protein